MTINVTTLESNLTTKINATSGTTDAKEFLLLGKAVEAVNTAVAANSLQVANNLSDLNNVTLLVLTWAWALWLQQQPQTMLN